MERLCVIRLVMGLLPVMAGFFCNECLGQSVTFNHDPAVMNQFLVGEVGTGALMPPSYYTMFHRTYYQWAYLNTKSERRLDFQYNVNREEKYSEDLDSALVQRAKIEAENVIDRDPSLMDGAYIVERAKVETKLAEYKGQIERITLMGGTVSDYRYWLERYNAIICGLEAVRGAYEPTASRHKEYLAVYKDAMVQYVQVTRFLDYLAARRTVEGYLSDHSPGAGVLDVASAARSALGRWKAAMAEASGK